MLIDSFLSQRDWMCALTKFTDCTSVDLIVMTGDRTGSGGMTYGMFIAMRAYW